MVLSEEQIKELVEGSESPILKENRKLQNEHKVHINGDGYEALLSQIIGYESTEQHDIKKLLTRPFTKPVCKYIIDAQGRWKTAQGTSKYYVFNGNQQESSKDFRTEVLSQVWKGSSMENFINKFLSKAIYTDFNGFFVVDKGAKVDVDGVNYEFREGKPVQQIEADHKFKPYIIYKSVDDVHSFSVTGETVDWLIYKVAAPKGEEKANAEFFRVLDSKYDYLIKKSGGNATLFGEKREHNAEQTPVVPVSTINKEIGEDRTRTSPIDALLPLLDYYLNQYGEHVTSCILHSHPVYYQVGQECTYSEGDHSCDGGYIELFDKATNDYVRRECPNCKGSGYKIHKDASTAIILPAVTEQGDAYNISNVAGYATPPVDILEFQIKELDTIKHEILEAATGQLGSQIVSERTATEAVLNLKPLEDIIAEIIEVIEKAETRLTNIIGKMWAGDKYVGCEINYGRKLNLRDENLIIEEIKESKATGQSYFYIKTLYDELIYSRFSRSSQDLERNKIIAELEPYIGFTYDEIEKSASISALDKKIKQNFINYLQRLEEDEGDIVERVDKTDFRKNIRELKDKIRGYAEEDLNNERTTNAIDFIS